MCVVSVLFLPSNLPADIGPSASVQLLDQRRDLDLDLPVAALLSHKPSLTRTLTPRVPQVHEAVADGQNFVSLGDRQVQVGT